MFFKSLVNRKHCKVNLILILSEESATIRYRLGMGMVSDEEDSRDFDSENGNLTAPVTDLTGVTGDSTACQLTGEGFTELSGAPGSEMTDVSVLLQNTSGRKHGHSGSTQQEVRLFFNSIV